MAIIDGFEKKYSQLESNEEKKKVLDYLYDTGRLLGLQKFYQDYPELRPKKEKTEDQIELQDRLKEFHRAVKEENPIENDQ
jgi:hypothetical protein